MVETIFLHPNLELFFFQVPTWGDQTTTSGGVHLKK